MYVWSILSPFWAGLRLELADSQGSASIVQMRIIQKEIRCCGPSIEAINEVLNRKQQWNPKSFWDTDLLLLSLGYLTRQNYHSSNKCLKKFSHLSYLFQGICLDTTPRAYSPDTAKLIPIIACSVICKLQEVVRLALFVHFDFVCCAPWCGSGTLHLLVDGVHATHDR